jgi:hypothetical protein
MADIFEHAAMCPSSFFPFYVAFLAHANRQKLIARMMMMVVVVWLVMLFVGEQPVFARGG